MSSSWPLVASCIVGVSIGIIVGQAMADPPPSADARAKRFIEQYEATVRPLEVEMNLAWWKAEITGEKGDFERKQAVEEKMALCLADPQRFAELKAIREARPTDAILAREIQVLYLKYLEQQVPPELIKKMLAHSNAVERTFSTFRAQVGGKKLTDNEVRHVLTTSHDSAERKAAWEASKAVGQEVLADLKAVVALRNEAAKRLGFSDFFALRLYLNEQNEQQLFKLFDELNELMRQPFHEAKAELDAVLAKNCGISVAELRPWHYHDPFFQESPAVLGELPESVYRSLNTIETVRAFYDGIGLPIDDVIHRSDLYEKPGKNQHAFCQDIDREGDVRVLENIVPGREWMGTTLHEFGHSVYSSKNVPRTLPYVLRAEAHTLTTEGVAMMMERFAQNADWLIAMGAKVPDPQQFRTAAAKLRRNRLLIFSRWCQVMTRFERELYRNPDQDLNKLWWDLAEKYQELHRPEGRSDPDFAAKYHIVGAPIYYHNYMLGEMFASQLHHALVRAVVPGFSQKQIVETIRRGPLGRRVVVPAARVSPAMPLSAVIYTGNKAAGKFMKERVFDLGLTLPWNELARHATGAELSPKALAEDIGIAK
jgi:peptidyl-dipeptidase A